MLLELRQGRLDDRALLRPAVDRDLLEGVQRHQVGVVPMRPGEGLPGREHQGAVLVEVPGLQARACGVHALRDLLLAELARHARRRLERDAQHRVVVVRVGREPRAQRVVVDLGAARQRQDEVAVVVLAQECEQRLRALARERVRALAQELAVRRQLPVAVEGPARSRRCASG